MEERRRGPSLEDGEGKKEEEGKQEGKPIFGFPPQIR